MEESKCACKYLPSYEVEIAYKIEDYIHTL